MAFQHVANHADLYRILLKNEKSDRILERIRKIVAQSITEFMRTKIKTDPIPILFEVPIDLLAAYFSGALLSCVDWWLEQGKSYSTEEMTRMFQRLFFPGARKILGVPPSETDPENNPTEIKRKVLLLQTSAPAPTGPYLRDAARHFPCAPRATGPPWESGGYNPSFGMQPLFHPK